MPIESKISYICKQPLDSSHSDGEEVYKDALFSFLPQKRALVIEGNADPMPFAEYAILRILTLHANEVVPPAMLHTILEAVYKRKLPERSLSTQLSNLRRRIDAGRNHPSPIETVLKYGYRFNTSR